MCLQRVLEAEENGDSFQGDDEFELDAPKRKNRNRHKVRNPTFDAFLPADPLPSSQSRGRELLCDPDVVFQNRASSRRRTEAASIEDQDKPYVCDSKRTRGPRPRTLSGRSKSCVVLDTGDNFQTPVSPSAVFVSWEQPALCSMAQG